MMQKLLVSYGFAYSPGTIHKYMKELGYIYLKCFQCYFLNVYINSFGDEP